MTVRDFCAKQQRIAHRDGYARATLAAMKEIHGKTTLRAYLAYLQHKQEKRLPAQYDYLQDLWQQDSYCLIVLDAGRYDYLKPILSEYFTGTVKPVFSHARDTFEWISRTWDGPHQDVTYLAGMVPCNDEIGVFENDDFNEMYFSNPGDSLGKLHKLWDTEMWDTSVATVPPEAITEYALDYQDREKLVVHYNQPHSPYIGTPHLLGHQNNKHATPGDNQPVDMPIWERVRSGRTSDETLLAAYIGNAVRAICALEPLVERFENVVITADHGEALGEYGVYAHHRAPHPKRRVVPWLEVTGTATQDTETHDMDVQDRLEALGYH